jgi:hypothetical protein
LGFVSVSVSVSVLDSVSVSVSVLYELPTDTLELEKYEEKRIMKDTSLVKDCYKKLEMVQRLRNFFHEIREKHDKLVLVQFESLYREEERQASANCTNLVSEMLQFMTKFVAAARDRSNKEENNKDRAPLTTFSYAECMKLHIEDLNTFHSEIGRHFYLADFSVIETLVKDSSHLKLPAPLMALQYWLEGKRPNPRCVYVSEEKKEQCGSIALDFEVKLCTRHRCGFQDGTIFIRRRCI